MAVSLLVSALRPLTLLAFAAPLAAQSSALGSFAGADGHAAAGAFVVTHVGDRQQLTFDSTFRVERGPDVYVVLSSAEKPSRGTDLYLGKVKSFRGGQTYDIPAGTDLSRFRYVVLWCERYGVTMGRGELQTHGMKDDMKDGR